MSPRLPSPEKMSFPVNFAMNFTDRMTIYKLIGSHDVPDSETLTIPLMRMQIIGLPVRNNGGEDWVLLTYQNLDDVVLQHDFMAGWYFTRVTDAFSLVGFI